MSVGGQLERLSARWKSASSPELREAIDSLFDNRSDSRWSHYCFDGRETSPDDPDASLVFYPSRLTSLPHFRFCSRKPSLRQVAVNQWSKYDHGVLERVAAFFQAFPHEQARTTSLSCYFSESAEPSDDIYGDFVIRLNGMSLSGGATFAVLISQFRNLHDREQRLRVFKGFISSLGLSDALTIVREGDAFRIEATAPWKVGVSGANLRKQNPSTFVVEPLDDFGKAWSRVRRALQSAIVKRIDNVGFGIVLTPEHYESLYKELDELAVGWQVDLFGSYAEGIDPYTAEASQSPDGRFPMFTWIPEREGKGVYFEADIVPKSDGRYLEIHSNCGDADRLLKEAESTTGVEFTPVQST